VSPIDDQEEEPDTTTTDPCPGCVPKHPDLEPSFVDIVSSSTKYPSDPYAVVEPEGVRIEVRVHNGGDTVAVGGRVIVSFYGYTDTLDVAPVTVNAVWIGQVEFDVRGTSPFRITSTSRAEAKTLLESDTVAANDRLTSKTYRIAVPCYQVRTENLVDSARVNQPWPVRILVDNLSPYAAGPPASTTLCLWDDEVWCRAEFWTVVARFAVPALGPAETYVLAESVVIPPTAAWQDEAVRYTAKLHVMEPPTADPYHYPSLSAATLTKALLLRPDYEGACHPPSLVPDQPLSLDAYNCGLRPPTTRPRPYTGVEPTLRYRFHLVRFDAAAGRTYRIERSDDAYPFRGYEVDGELLEDLDPAPDRVSYRVSGRVYLALYTRGPELTVTLREKL
jgi:hypothetical protein